MTHTHDGIFIVRALPKGLTNADQKLPENPDIGVETEAIWRAVKRQCK